MRLLDKSGKQLYFVYTFLTRDEARELINQLQRALEEEADDDDHFFDERFAWWSQAALVEKIQRASSNDPETQAAILNPKLRELRLCTYDYETAASQWTKSIQELIADHSGKIETVDLDFKNMES